MVSNNFEALKRTVDGQRTAIVVLGRLVDDQFALVPNTDAVVSALARSMDDMLDTLRSVPRWLHGTSIRCPVVQLPSAGDDESLPAYSFYDRALLDCVRVAGAEERCYGAIENIGDRLDDLARR